MGVRVHSGLGQTGRRGVVPTMLLGIEPVPIARTDVYERSPVVADPAAMKAAAKAAMKAAVEAAAKDVVAKIKAAKPVVPPAAQPAATAPGIFDQLTAWGNQQMIPGIPNLYLAVGGLLAVMAMGQKRRA